MAILAFWREGIIVLLLVGLALLFAGYKGAKADLKVSEANYAACMDANRTNVDTISALQVDQKRSGQTCEARLKGKDALIIRLKKICGVAEQDESRPYGPENAGGTDAQSGAVGSDAGVMQLNGMFNLR